MITNEQFKEAKKKYKNFIALSLINYRGIAEISELNQLANIALWKSMIKFDNKKSSFIGFLSRMIKWEMLSYHREQQVFLTNKKMTKLKSRRNLEKELVDITDSLNNLETKIFKSKFVGKHTLKEIAEQRNLHSDTIFEHIKKIKDKIKTDLTSY